MSNLDKVFYYLSVFATFGTTYFLKVVILKAINDSQYEQIRRN